MLRLVVTGSRKFRNQRLVEDWIAEAIQTYRVMNPRDFTDYTTLERVTLIHGAAPGFDRLAASVAFAWGMGIEPYPAQWEDLGRSAGMARNWQMVLHGKPNFALVGPGGTGTQNMHKLLIKHAIPLLYKGDHPIT